MDFGESIAGTSGSSASQTRMAIQNRYTIAINASATPESMGVAVRALGQV